MSADDTNGEDTSSAVNATTTTSEKTPSGSKPTIVRKTASVGKAAKHKVSSFWHKLGRGVHRVLVTIGLLAAGILIGQFLIVSGLFSVPGLFQSWTGDSSTLSEATLREVVKPASDLIITRRYYKDAAVIDNSKHILDYDVPFTEDVKVFTYEGTIGLGFDLSEVTYHVDDASKTITVQLPEIGIISNEIDPSSIEVKYNANSVFNDNDMTEITSTQAELMQKQADQTLANTDIMSQAKENAQTVLKDFLTADSRTSDYSVVFEDQEAE